jgi:hypothetical protein
MIRPEIGENINGEEFKQILKPFLNNYDEFLESYILSKITVHYIANAYYSSTMYETT